MSASDESAIDPAFLDVSKFDPHQELQMLSGEGKPIYRVAKRLFDLVASLCGLILFSPLFIAIAVLIFVDDPHGSSFYSQTRVGKGGRKFKFWKFRSMVVNADALLKQLKDKNEKDGPVFKIKDDPRVTRIGRFIRKTSIDELPQLWNVFLGNMSLVGPRPPIPTEVAQYNEYQMQRLLVKPGLTCYWQASDNRDDFTFDEWVGLDIKYIQDRCFWLDIKLIFLTVKVVLTGQGH
jgi:Sugar transferases involved in lipopolysaccharide synthesis